jgi:LAS superfamily LD-carboxypeptidase LdcB
MNRERLHNHINTVFIAPLAALAIAGCGAVEANKNHGSHHANETTLTTTTAATSGESKSKQIGPDYNLKTTIITDQLLSETALAIIDAKKINQSNTQSSINTVEQQIESNYKNDRSFTPNTNHLIAGQHLYLDLKPSQYQTYANDLAQQVNEHLPVTPVPAENSKYVFLANVSKVTPKELGQTWHKGCPVSYSDLRNIQMTYIGFDNKTQIGDMVINKSVVGQVELVFEDLDHEGVPIRQMKPLSSYSGNTNQEEVKAVKDDDTSDFVCRKAIATGSAKANWSEHSYGTEVDFNDRENPYQIGDKWVPANSYKNRLAVRPGMTEPDNDINNAFASVGWKWGGLWTQPDYGTFYENDQ